MKKYCKLCGFVDGEGNIDICPICKSTDWEDADLITLKRISNDPDFIQAMTKLHDEDPIEYQLKMSQFKANLGQQESNKRVEEDNRPKCPNCHSTNIKAITGTERAMSIMGLGLFSKKINKSFKCLRCKYTW